MIEKKIVNENYSMAQQLKCVTCNMPLMQRKGKGTVCVTCPKVRSQARRNASRKRMEEKEALRQINCINFSNESTSPIDDKGERDENENNFPENGYSTKLPIKSIKNDKEEPIFSYIGSNMIWMKKLVMDPNNSIDHHHTIVGVFADSATGTSDPANEDTSYIPSISDEQASKLSPIDPKQNMDHTYVEHRVQNIDLTKKRRENASLLLLGDGDTMCSSDEELCIDKYRVYKKSETDTPCDISDDDLHDDKYRICNKSHSNLSYQDDSIIFNAISSDESDILHSIEESEKISIHFNEDSKVMQTKQRNSFPISSFASEESGIAPLHKCDKSSPNLLKQIETAVDVLDLVSTYMTLDSDSENRLGDVDLQQESNLNKHINHSESSEKTSSASLVSKVKETETRDFGGLSLKRNYAFDDEDNDNELIQVGLGTNEPRIDPGIKKTITQ